jgi:hypothetical protein
MERRKRPPLDRTKPVRTWTVPGTAPAAPAAGTEPPAAPPRPDDTRLRPRFQDAVGRSVELGYRVVDDYIQQGQRAAQRLSEGRLSAEVLTSEVNDLGGRIARYASDFFGAWVELLELAAVGSAARQSTGNGPVDPEAPPAAAATPPPARRAGNGGLRVAVTASRPVEVALDLRGERVTGALRAHELRAADPKKPRLSDVKIVNEGAGATPVLRVRVPDQHPEGTYEGLLIDEGTNRPVGNVRLVVSAAPRAARARRARPPRRPRRKGRAPR